MATSETGLARGAIGLREVLFQSVTSMAPAGAVALSIAAGATYAGGALPLAVLPGHLGDMHRRIAGSQLVIIEDASHLCFAEQPETFNRTLNSFLT